MSVSVVPGQIVGAMLDIEGQDWLAENAAEVLDAVVDAIVTIDASGVIQSCNQAAETMFGFADAELRGQPVSILMPEHDSRKHQGYVDNYLTTGQKRIIGIGRELVAQRRDGSQFPIYLAVSPVSDNRFFVGIIRDLSEQKLIANALEDERDKVAKAARLASLGEMSASIAHEINQPLSAITMYAQALRRMLENQEGLGERVLEALEKLNDQALRAGDVIERIQRFVQHSQSERHPNDIYELIVATHQLAAGDARVHGVHVDYPERKQAYTVDCDMVQIQQVLLNLLRNAIDAMHELKYAHGNKILVDVEALADSRFVRVSVSDCGAGVAEQHMPRLFQAFHTTKKDGMGLGLSICRNIIRAHGGEMGFKNNDGPGATFYFDLPLATDV